ncbi:degenerin-like protein asic-1 isoform X1 [Parasteatoda tepidariorum]|uniref:degenerin-like protein asic-1 isoform X1 n=1 Tax=Parasteatoda tepidariorum TaxID=114398 RepID=UPI001C71C801|nr:degenerin-like protein asic-1 isoform X1 [Parasteatoda tepidariorum]
MVLASFPEEYFYHSDPVIMYAAVHDRKHLVDPYTKGIIMKGGYRYTAFVSMKEELRLPYPYGSNCMDYLKEWRKNNGTGPLNELACIEYCKLRKLKFNNECIDEHTWYAPHRETLCNIGQERVTDKIIKECSMECKPACQEQKYEIDYDEVEFESRLCDVGEENCKLSSIYLRVSFRKFILSRRIFQPKYNSIELFSYIGGYMGMWLGINLVSIFDLSESIFLLFHFPFKRKKAQRSGIEPQHRHVKKHVF